jgi:hypothetical protein
MTTSDNAVKQQVIKAAFLLFALFCAASAFAQVGFKSTNVWFPNMDVGGDPNGLHYVVFYMDIIDSLSNSSNVISIPFKF